MSRTIINAVVLVVIAAVTAAAYVAVSSTVNAQAEKQANFGVARARKQAMRTEQLESLSVLSKVEQLASDPRFAAALRSTAPSERSLQAGQAFSDFKGRVNPNLGEEYPDYIVLLDATGNLVARSDGLALVPKQWKDDKGAMRFPSLAEAQKAPVSISEFWELEGLRRVGVATVIDPNLPVTPENPKGVPVGCVVIAYSQTAKAARDEADAMGVELAYLASNKTYATSFRSGKGDENTARARNLDGVVTKHNSTLFAANASLLRFELDGDTWVGTSLPLPRQSSRALSYQGNGAAAIVLAPIAATGDLAAVKTYVLLVGLVAMVLALLGMYFVHRRLMSQVDPLEIGVTDIINGNIDRTFRPVGAELDGLANGLNVMMARLLGRPEPGDEQLDDDGNPIVPGRVEFEEAEQNAPSKSIDPELEALARESEPDYYKRIFTEYLAARTAAGQPDDVSFENFIAKLKVNEGKLKAQFNCKSVRFRVVTKDGKVTLKPVPLFG